MSATAACVIGFLVGFATMALIAWGCWPTEIDEHAKHRGIGA